MKQTKQFHQLKRVLLALIIPTLVGFVLILSTRSGNASVSAAYPLETEVLSSLPEEVHQLTATETTTLYLPIIMKSYPWVSPFGIENDQLLVENSQIINRAEELGNNWVRVNHQISWRELQPNEGDPIDWSKLAGFENALKGMKARGMTSPLIGKFSTALWVCAPHKAQAGTWSSPMLSLSVRVSPLAVGVCSLMFTTPNFVSGTRPERPV